jgi:outer membrane biosynthesis protein TonB
MPIPDEEMLGPRLERRLKAALDEVVPPSPTLSSARYRMGAIKSFSRAWRFAPALVAIAAAGAVLTATAATGSPNPAIWRDRAGTVIQNVSHFPGPSPKAVPSKKPAPRVSPTSEGSIPAHPTPSSGHPKPTSEPSDRPEPTPSPEPTDRQQPSPTPDPSPGSGPAPSPPPDGGGD